MFQLQGALSLGQIQHHHGGNEWHDMYEVEDAHDPASIDPERSWQRAKIYRCSTCEDEIRVVVPDEAGDEGARTT